MRKYGTVREVPPFVSEKINPCGFTVLEYGNVPQMGFLLKKLPRYGKTNIAIFVPKSERGDDL